MIPAANRCCWQRRPPHRFLRPLALLVAAVLAAAAAPIGRGAPQEPRYHPTTVQIVQRVRQQRAVAVGKALRRYLDARHRFPALNSPGAFVRSLTTALLDFHAIYLEPVVSHFGMNAALSGKPAPPPAEAARMVVF